MPILGIKPCTKKPSLITQKCSDEGFLKYKKMYKKTLY